MSQPIAGYGLLSDCRSAALVGRNGSVDWWTAPRFDSPSAFSRLLDADAGHFSIAPTAPFGTERRCLPGTMVLESTLRTGEAALRLTDALVLAPGARGHDIGMQTP